MYSGLHLLATDCLVRRTITVHVLCARRAVVCKDNLDDPTEVVDIDFSDGCRVQGARG